MGVWIEILSVIDEIKIVLVTPLVGVWIEIIAADANNKLGIGSLPLWECGLKLLLSARHG